MLPNFVRFLRRRGSRLLTSVLDVAGLGLIVAAAAVWLGEAAALAAAGVSTLAVSWSLTKATRA